MAAKTSRTHLYVICRNDTDALHIQRITEHLPSLDIDASAEETHKRMHMHIHNLRREIAAPYPYAYTLTQSHFVYTLLKQNKDHPLVLTHPFTHDSDDDDEPSEEDNDEQMHAPDESEADEHDSSSDESESQSDSRSSNGGFLFSAPGGKEEHDSCSKELSSKKDQTSSSTPTSNVLQLTPYFNVVAQIRTRIIQNQPETLPSQNKSSSHAHVNCLHTSKDAAPCIDEVILLVAKNPSMSSHKLEHYISTMYIPHKARSKTYKNTQELTRISHILYTHTSKMHKYYKDFMNAKKTKNELIECISVTLMVATLCALTSRRPVLHTFEKILIQGIHDIVFTNKTHTWKLIDTTLQRIKLLKNNQTQTQVNVAYVNMLRNVRVQKEYVDCSRDSRRNTDVINEARKYLKQCVSKPMSEWNTSSLSEIVPPTYKIAACMHSICFRSKEDMSQEDNHILKVTHMFLCRFYERHNNENLAEIHELYKYLYNVCKLYLIARVSNIPAICELAGHIASKEINYDKPHNVLDFLTD
jgi:hypothetical protein